MINKTEERIELTAIDRGATAAIGNVTNSLGGLRTGLDTVKSAMAAVGLTLGAGAMVAYGAEIIKTTAAIKGMSEATGASVANLLKIENVARVNGHEFRGITDAIGMMIRNLNSSGEASERTVQALSILGIKARESNGQIRDGAQIMIDMAKALDKYEDSGNKVALVQAVLGRSGQQYMQLLKDMAKDGDRVSKTTEEQIEKADQYEKNVRRLQTAVSDISRGFLLNMVPALDAVARAMVRAQREGGTLAAIAAGIRVGTTGDDQHKNDKRLVELTDQQLRLERQIAEAQDPSRPYRGVRVDMLRKQLDAVNAELATTMAYRGQLATEQAADSAPSGTLASVPELPDTSAEKKAAASATAAAAKAKAEAIKRAAEEMRLYNQAAQAVVDLDTAQGKALADTNQAWSERTKQIEFETKLIGMGDADREKLIAFRQVDLELQRQMVDLAPEQIAALYELAEAEKARLGAAIDGRAARQGVEKMAEEAKRAHEEAARAAEQEWNDLWSNVESTGRTVFASLFADGTNAMEGIGKAIKASIIDMLYQLTVRKWIINIGASISGVGAAGAANAGGFGGFSPSSLLDLGGALEFMSGAASTFGGSAAATAALIESGTVGMAGAGMEFGAGVGASTGAMSMLGPLGIGFGLLSATGMLDGIFGGGGGPKPSEIWLQGGPGSFNVGIDNASGGTDIGAVRALNALLADSSTYDQGQLAGMVGRRFSTGAPADTGTLIGMLTQALAPAQKAAEDAARAQEDAATATAQAARELEQMRDQEARLAESLTSAVRGLPGQLGIDSLTGYRDSLATSAVRSPTARLGAARGIFESTYARAIGGDLDAVREVPEAAQTLLGIGRETYASGSGFQSIFADVNRSIGTLIDRQQTVQAEILSSVPGAIIRSAADQMGELRKQTATLVEGFERLSSEVRRLSTGLLAR